MALSNRPVQLLTLACAAVLACGCHSQSEESPRPQPPTPPAPMPVPVAEPTPAPSITLGPTAYTYEADNRDHWIEVDVTVQNEMDVAVRMDWERLVALADCTMANPSWSNERRPSMLAPGEEIAAQVSWGCYPPPGNRPLPTSVTIRYFNGQQEALSQELPVRPLPTTGTTLRYDAPAHARSFTEPEPAHGGGWDVCVHAVATNGTDAPLIFLPYIDASVIAPEGAVGTGSGWLGQRITRLDPGTAVSDNLCLRFYGEDSPAPERIQIQHRGEPDTQQEIEVTGG